MKAGSQYSLLLRFQKALVFVGGGAADVADSCQFAAVQLPILMGCLFYLFAVFGRPFWSMQSQERSGYPIKAGS